MYTNSSCLRTIYSINNGGNSRNSVFDEGGVEQHNFIRAAPNELFTGQQTAAHQTIVDNVVICYNDLLVLGTVKDSN